MSNIANDARAASIARWSTVEGTSQTADICATGGNRVVDMMTDRGVQKLIGRGL